MKGENGAFHRRSPKNSIKGTYYLDSRILFFRMFKTDTEKGDKIKKKESQKGEK